MALSLQQGRAVSIRYHSLFNYPLDRDELVKWRAGKKVELKEFNTISSKEKLERKKDSEKKIRIAQKAAKLLEKVPTIKLVAITGSLAMKNVRKESDIDLMIITAQDSLWTTRIIAILFLFLSGMKLRHAGDKNEKDKLCLNIWLDERRLEWQKKNIFTAHEICQIVPLVNKNQTYERFLQENRWVLAYWPNAVRIEKQKLKPDRPLFKNPKVIEELAFFLQYQYMRGKITNETVTKTRALFHPSDLSKLVSSSIKPT